MLEHLAGGRVQGPVASLSGHVIIAVVRARPIPRYLHEAVVQAEIVPYAVLPALPVLPVVGEPVHDELVDPGERQPLLRRRVDRHRDQGDVGIRWLLVMRRGLVANRRSRKDRPGRQRRLTVGRPGRDVSAQHLRDQAGESVHTFHREHLVDREDTPVSLTSSTQTARLILRVREETVNLGTTTRLHRESTSNVQGSERRLREIAAIVGAFRRYPRPEAELLRYRFFSRRRCSVGMFSIATHPVSREIEVTSLLLFGSSSLSRDEN